MSPLPAPRPRVFPVSGISSTPRCGHTLTALAGPDGDLQGARLVLFGEPFTSPFACRVWQQNSLMHVACPLDAADPASRKFIWSANPKRL